jgi:hypothetical protein
LARRLKHPRLQAFRKDNPLGMPLQLVDDIPNETHGRKLAGTRESAIVLAREERKKGRYSVNTASRDVSP